MWFNHYEAERMMEERVKDVLREVKQARLIRAAKGPRKERKWRLRLALTLESLLATFTDRRVDELRRQSSSAASSQTWKRCSDS